MGDALREAKQRCSNLPDVRQEIVMDLQQMLHQYNSYVHVFKSALQRMPSDHSTHCTGNDQTCSVFFYSSFGIIFCRSTRSL